MRTVLVCDVQRNSIAQLSERCLRNNDLQTFCALRKLYFMHCRLLKLYTFADFRRIRQIGGQHRHTGKRRVRSVCSTRFQSVERVNRRASLFTGACARTRSRFRASRWKRAPLTGRRWLSGSSHTSTGCFVAPSPQNSVIRSR